MGAWVKGSLNFAITLPGGTGAVEGVTDYVPGFPLIVESVKAYFTVVAAGAGASRAVTVVRTNGSTDTTIASATVVLADGDTLGKEKVFTTTPTELSDASKLSIMFASAGAVAFSGGVMNVVINYRTRVQELVGS